MIPKEYRTPRTDHLQRVLDSFRKDITKLENLTEADFELLGRYVQLYTFIELNLRRCIEIFCRAGLLSAAIASIPNKVAPRKLVPRLKACVRAMSPTDEDIATSLRNLDEIEFRRGIRNIVAHWAARRLPGEDALVFFSKDGRDEEQISGATQVQADYLRTAILDLTTLRALALHINPYEEWIAEKTAEWHQRYITEEHEC